MNYVIKVEITNLVEVDIKAKSQREAEELADDLMMSGEILSEGYRNYDEYTNLLSVEERK